MTNKLPILGKAIDSANFYADIQQKLIGKIEFLDESRRQVSN